METPTAVAEGLRFPVDIFAVKEYGVRRWQDVFFWPVSDAAFEKLHSDIEECYRRHISRQGDPAISEVIFIQNYLLLEYRLFLHALKVVQEIASGGGRVTHSEKSMWYRNISSNTLGRWEVLRLRPEKTAREVFAVRAKTLVKYFMYNRGLARFLRSAIGGKNAATCGNVSTLMKNYILKMPRWADITVWQSWLTGDGPGDAAKRYADGIKGASAALAGEVSAIARGNGITLSEGHVEHLRRVTETGLTDAALLLEWIRGNVKKAHTLLLECVGTYYYRALALAIKEKGGRVFGFTHGGHIGLYNTITPSFSEFAVADRFITYTKASAGLFERIKDSHAPIRQNVLEIESADSDEYLRLTRKYRRTKRRADAKRVLYIGYPHNQQRQYHASASLALMQLELELRVIDILKARGYEVLYKAHPDTIEDVRGVFDGACTVLERGTFDDYVDDADIFLFGSIRTTVFKAAICTAKPVVALKMENEFFKPFAEPFTALAKRCSFVRARFDERNRVIFDEDELLDAVAKRGGRPDDEFIRRYMFP